MNRTHSARCRCRSLHARRCLTGDEEQLLLNRRTCSARAGLRVSQEVGWDEIVLACGSPDADAAVATAADADAVHQKLLELAQEYCTPQAAMKESVSAHVSAAA